MRTCLLLSNVITIVVCMWTVGVKAFPGTTFSSTMLPTSTPSARPSATPTMPPTSTVCASRPTVDCEECLTDCCEELLISIKTWEDCNCTPLNGTQADDENYLYRRIYYKQLFIWLKEYCEDHNAHVHFHE